MIVDVHIFKFGRVYQETSKGTLLALAAHFHFKLVLNKNSYFVNKSSRWTQVDTKDTNRSSPLVCRCSRQKCDICFYPSRWSSAVRTRSAAEHWTWREDWPPAGVAGSVGSVYALVPTDYPTIKVNIIHGVETNLPIRIILTRYKLKVPRPARPANAPKPKANCFGNEFICVFSLEGMMYIYVLVLFTTKIRIKRLYIAFKLNFKYIDKFISSCMYACIFSRDFIYRINKLERYIYTTPIKLVFMFQNIYTHFFNIRKSEFIHKCLLKLSGNTFD